MTTRFCVISYCCCITDAESRLESERSSRQKAEKDLLEMEKLIGSLRVDVSQYEQRAATVTQELTAETDKVGTESGVAQITFCI